MKQKKVNVYIGMGSNLGDRNANISKAMKLIDLIKGLKLNRHSSIYETEPVDGPLQERYLNGVLETESLIPPGELLKKLQRIERELGRRRKIKNGPRTIDLDILLFGKRKINAKNLKIPHPRMHRREFVLRGLRELGALS